MKSDNAKKGVERAPHRSLFYAMGYTRKRTNRLLVIIFQLPSFYESRRLKN